MDYLDDEEIKNFVRLHSIQLPHVCQFLRKLFRTTWRRCAGEEWDDSAAQGKEFVEGVGKKFYEEESDKKVKEKLKSGCLVEWDVSLLCRLFLNLDFANSRPLNRSQRSKIQHILEIRNYLAHHGTNRITNEEFRDILLQIESILDYFGYPHVAGSNFDSFDESNDKEAQWFNDQGSSKFKLGQYREAISYYTEALELSDISKMDLAKFRANRSFAYLKLAVDEDDRDMLVRALGDAKMAVKLRPEWDKSLYRLGCVYQEMEKYKKALSVFSSILQYEPDSETVKIVEKARKFCLQQFYS